MKTSSLVALAITTGLLSACNRSPDASKSATNNASPAAATPAVEAPLPTRSSAPADAKLYIVSPANGAAVSNPVTIIFGLSGMGVAPAGVPFENAGHHHVLIDTDLPADLSLPLPANETHVHFGKGQTEATLTLTPGTHTLQLVLGNHLHIPFDPVVASEKISVTVQ